MMKKINASLENLTGIRLDLALKSFIKDSNRKLIQELISSSDITVNEKSVKPSLILKEGDFIYYKEESFIKPVLSDLIKQEDSDIQPLYEDDEIIVINKPQGVVTHPGPGHYTGTLVHAFFNKLAKTSEDRPGIVHRLDKDTQGLLVLAKTLDAHENLSSQFKNKTAKRIYWALCHGSFKEEDGVIKTNLARNPKNRKKISSQEIGKEAITEFKVLVNDAVSLVELSLQTGRTHQIRVHLSEKGKPVINDKIYGTLKRVNEIVDPVLRSRTKKSMSLGLVARKLSFLHPTSNEPLSFEVPWPEEFEKVKSSQGLILDGN